MSEKNHRTALDVEQPRPDESFLQRFHRRKTEARQQPANPAAGAAPSAPDGPAATDDQAVEPPELTDADMPPLESLTVDSDYSGFLSQKVSESLRRAALRRLFHSAQFNVLDELDDYAEDFTTFTDLGDLVTAEMRHRLEVEAGKRAEALEQALTGEPDEPAQPVTVEDDTTDDADQAPPAPAQST